MMKTGHNTSYFTPLQTNPIASKRSNAETCSTIGSDKEYPQIDDDCARSIGSTSFKKKERIYLLIEEILTSFNTPQVPTEYFREIHSRLKDQQFKSRFSTLATFKDFFVTERKSQAHRNYFTSRQTYVQYLYEVNKTLDHTHSFYSTVYLFDRLNEISYSKSLEKTVLQQKELTINVVVALNAAGKLCQIYPYRLEDILELTQLSIRNEIVSQREGEVILSLDWGLIPVSQFEFFQIYHILCDVRPHQYQQCLDLLAMGLANSCLMDIKPSTKAIAVLMVLGEKTSNFKITHFAEKLIILNETEEEDLNKAQQEYLKVERLIYKEELRRDGKSETSQCTVCKQSNN